MILQVCLQFYEKRQKTGGWFGRQEERLYWEQWYATMFALPSICQTFEEETFHRFCSSRVIELATVEPQISLQEQSSLTPASGTHDGHPAAATRTHDL